MKKRPTPLTANCQNELDLFATGPVFFTPSTPWENRELSLGIAGPISYEQNHNPQNSQKDQYDGTDDKQDESGQVGFVPVDRDFMVPDALGFRT